MNILNWILLIVFSIGAGVLYHLGGKGLPYNTKHRDWGIPTCMILFMSLSYHWHWILILCFGAVFGVQTTYFKKKRADANGWNWVLCGLSFGVSMLPWSVAMGHWVGWGLRVFVNTVFVWGWSIGIGRVAWEEGGRGFIQIFTLPLLFI